MTPSLSIVIPVSNEAEILPETLPPLLRLPDVEVIVVDGASTDGTPEMARGLGATQVVRASSPCRGLQLDLGARRARSERLLFLHADARPPERLVERIDGTLSRDGVILGAFSIRFDGRGGVYRLMERSTALRVAVTSTPYGDQGLFLRRSDYIAAGGYPHWPLLEDVQLIRRLRSRGRIVVLPDPITVSTRRYRHSGTARTVLRNRLVSTLWALRVPAPVIWGMVGIRGPATAPLGATDSSPSSPGS